jgi:hypothetical protein
MYGHKCCNRIFSAYLFIYLQGTLLLAHSCEWVEAIRLQQMKAKCSTRALRNLAFIKLAKKICMQQHFTAERKVIAANIFKFRNGF